MTEGTAMRAAIKELEDKLDRAQKEVADTKKAINVMLEVLGEPVRFPNIDQADEEKSKGIRSDQYFRKSITVAARDYLKSKGSAATVDEIIDALRKGGCALGQHPQRNVRISLSKNSKTFAQINDDTFGLWDFYGGRPRKKAEAEATEEPDTDIESVEETTSEPVEETESGNEETALMAIPHNQ